MKNSTTSPAETSLFQTLQQMVENKEITLKQSHILKNFYLEYRRATLSHFSEKGPLFLFQTLFSLIQKEVKRRSYFAPYHTKVRSPFDYYQFGLDFTRPLIDFKNSLVLGEEHLKQAEELLKEGSNVIFLANHQTELDPQIMDLLLQEKFPLIGRDTIFVAGERVTTDIAAIPFSLGRDLICIYSKKYIDIPAELKEQKQRHNHKTMQRLRRLLSEGGKSIYVAPSGGRDRRDLKGQILPAPFDPQSIELFYLLAKKSKYPVFFYPLALYTYSILPPPDTIQTEIGEERHANFAFCRLAFGEKISSDLFANETREKRRKKRADFIWNMVKKNYQKLLQGMLS